MRPAEDWMETVSTLDCIRLRKSAVLRICKGPLKKSYFSQADYGRCQKLRTGAAGQRPVGHVLWVHSRGLLLPQGITESWLP